MSEAAVFQDLVDQVCNSGTISADDVLALRRQVFPDGAVSAEEAEAVFRLDHACGDKAAEWTRFYVDALTDYFVWQSKPRGYVNDAQARALIDNIQRDGRIDAASELELLLNVVHWCMACPAELSRIALSAVKDSVLTPEAAAYGFTARRFNAEEALRMGLVNGVIPKADLEGEVRATAERIADNAPLTLRSIKLIARELTREPARRDTKAVAASVRACFESDDYREGMRAFLEKRPPGFRGR